MIMYYSGAENIVSILFVVYIKSPIHLKETLFSISHFQCVKAQQMEEAYVGVRFPS